MSIWGKLFGGVAGFAVGGPVGGIVGTMLGHAADKGSLFNTPPGGWSEGWKNRLAPDPAGASAFIAAKMAATFGQREQLYSLCLIILSAKLAKIDAPVNRTEINSFKQLLNIPTAQTKPVGQLFDAARQRTDDYENYATLLAQSYANDPLPLEDLLRILYRLALSDAGPTKALHSSELRFLQRLHGIFGLSDGAWDRIREGSARPSANPHKAYQVLGLSVSATDEEIRMKWKALLMEYHPDRLSAKGASEADIAKASQKVADINAAWDQIKRDRKI
ncbi:J domain-containing protein [Entomobacter blattae]|uniref:DnaJ-like protein DjlA n=1 Tax=Entomobacter blattae TaxID=2762277 RepID=A0A7H1NR08_9PROT|nr:DnaJ family molecular chaperone [Entomobacter blattae]QNT78218.1 DnaJ-like protein DjlA [Entomobacter blattae]